jgi:chromosome segregation ATPase
MSEQQQAQALPPAAAAAPPAAATAAPARARQRQVARKRAPTPGTPPAPAPDTRFDDTAGISDADQKEILGEIEKIATESRIQVSDEVFTLHPQRKGAVFPVVINLFFLALLAGGIGALGVIFGAEERSLVQDQVAFTTTEGRLIEELKKESQEKLKEKEREIGQIQDRMGRLDQERRDLESTMSTRIQNRERELRAALDAELAGERDKLRGQGISEAEIATRMRAIETQRSQEYNTRLAAFRAQAEDERRRAEDNLRTLQSEYSQNLQNLNRERDQLAQDSRRREDELRSQLEARTSSLEREKSTIEQQLSRLAEERQKEDLAAGQLNGFYTTLRDQLRGAQYDQGLATIGSIKSFLAEDRVAQLPGMLKRREVELFVVDSLTRLVESQKSRETTDTGSLVAQAALVTELRQAVAAADAAAGRRDLPEAERLYRRAISMIPDVEKSYSYLASLRDQGDAERRARLDGLLAQGETAFAQGQADRALQFYRQALEFLPTDQASRDRLLARLQASGYAQGAARDRADAATAAAAPLAQARALLAEARYPEAAAAYLDALSRQPPPAQAREAVEGINRAVAQQKQVADAGGGALQQQLAARLAEVESLRRDLAARDQRIGEAEAQIVQLQNALVDLREKTVPELSARIDAVGKERDRLAAEAADRGRLSEQVTSQSEDQKRLAAERDEARATGQRLTTERDEARAELERLTVERDRLTASIDALNKELASLKQEIAALRQKPPETAPAIATTGTDAASRDEMQRLLRVEKTFKDLQQSYRQYAAAEDQILKSSGPDGLLETKLKLDAFLTSDIMDRAFPGLWNRIKRYDRAFQDVGRDVAVQDLADIVYGLTLAESTDARLKQIDKQIQANKSDAPMVELLNELKRLVR